MFIAPRLLNRPKPTYGRNDIPLLRSSSSPMLRCSINIWPLRGFGVLACLDLLGGLMLKTIVILMLSTFALSTGASGCHAKQNAALPPQTPNSETTTKGLKVLAEGFHSSVTNPFIAVVRDAETYSELTRLDNNLPKLDEEFFKSNIVVAAFLGERNTGGYSVEITREANGDTRIS